MCIAGSRLIIIVVLTWYVGNYGSQLSSDPNDVDLYISRDGGLHWEQASYMSFLCHINY